MNPKHIGFGPNLHLAKILEKLVDLFHAAGNVIGMDTIRRLDTTIALDIIDRYNTNGHVYIPNDLVPYSPNQIVLPSCANIDVLEKTIDGKNTFHCTQMMLWQRSFSNIRPLMDIKQMNRAKTITSTNISEFHKLDHALLPVRERFQPVANFPPGLELDNWFDVSSDQLDSKIIKLPWIIARMGQPSQQVVPSWSAFKLLSLVNNSLITTPGMLPILQAPADDNITITTIINCFMAIAEHLGQLNTVIAVDQPLYSRSMKIIWGNNE